MESASTTPYANIATIVKTQGLKGEVVVKSTTGLPFALPVGSTVFFTPPSLRGVRSAKITGVSGIDYSAAVTFDAIVDIDGAKQLVGKTILARRIDIPESPFDPEVLVGREVVCVERGRLGTIVDILFSRANDVWVVQGRFGEVMIPVIDDVVLDVPEDSEQPISVRLLEGLIDSEAEEIDTTEGEIR
ncbi:MAG: 16S rRNA processing protein RimM [Actinobacteria bacterium]|nr:16S rRNA processing protein RimM [Actinomycetota bacterium]